MPNKKTKAGESKGFAKSKTPPFDAAPDVLEYAPEGSGSAAQRSGKGGKSGGGMGGQQAGGIKGGGKRKTHVGNK